MRITLQKINDNAQIPTQAREGDFCYDVVAVSEEEVAPNVWRYGMGFAYEIERGSVPLCYTETWISGFRYWGPTVIDLKDANIKLSIDFRPRSSVWKTGMILSNCEGTLDEFYRGEMMAVFYHVMPNMPRYKIGDKIGQIKLGITLPLEFEWGNIHTDTERGEGGFGSTGR